MPMREYYTVDRSPREIKDLWDWATKECRGKIEHESPYAMGVLATLEYLMGTSEDPPQAYNGVFSLPNVLRHCEQPHEVGGVRDPRVNKALDDDLQPLGTGNPKALFYETPLLDGSPARDQNLVDDGNKAFRSDTDDGSGERRQATVRL